MDCRKVLQTLFERNVRQQVQFNTIICTLMKRMADYGGHIKEIKRVIGLEPTAQLYNYSSLVYNNATNNNIIIVVKLIIILVLELKSTSKQL